MKKVEGIEHGYSVVAEASNRVIWIYLVVIVRWIGIFRYGKVRCLSPMSDEIG